MTTRAVRALRHPGNWVQLAKFCVVGLSGYLVNLAVYSALLPPTWQVYSLKPDLVTEFSSADVKTFGCAYYQCTAFGCNHPSTFYPFGGALSANQFQSRFQMVPSTETSTNEVWT